ncbi:MAG: helix-turn-helix transcriptional regulator [Candidatus Aminicenantes bacterium]|nr:helix-turn-helix transcriptional regulator [Candidatus Aminicenantes bacterium]
MILFYFSSNVPALLAFRGYWRRRSVARPEPATEGRDPNAAFAGRGLTPRELEIVGLILQGQSNKDIERTLFISVHTVKNHLYKIYQKMGVRSRFQVVAMVRGDENSSPGNGPDQTG